MKLDFEEVSVAGLAKSYGPTLALAGVDLRFEAGEATVIRGSNGSGKSTLLWLLAMLAHPTRGEIRYGRYGVSRADELRGRIGFVAHQLQLYPGLSGHENLVLAAKLQNIPYAQKRATDLCEALSLDEYWERPVRTYSRGQAQRVSIARALLHQPRLLLMDEPATGLDIKSTASFIELVEQQKRDGAIILIVTHEAQFAGAVADRVLHMDRGRIAEPHP
ncbi:MAG: ABC transporter ATP-binding protein [Deltaproteobacteria bacterium]|nr:ABC transporter ATP-binding protein [Deltaproteobacteria bacterium]NND28222.1 ABC transporter ATP-binding protein [Myxococcales bacterium]MBT8466244.1 ABC transporter ATP-binding protein [Deltaproteobacteria bacterium]MBT8483776.1 ABC transporter ATP-binding protein [Deltaproteobacteria bacterium]NNK07154.1 ABC transporter ATP-binding protein [Myxococcales bacterium]